MNARRAPAAPLTFGALSSETATRILSAAADLAFLVGADGVIRFCAFRDPELGAAVGGHAALSGQEWADTLTVESRPKAEALLAAARADAPPRLRHLNHKSATEGPDVAIEYAAVRAADDTVVAFGRDLRPLAHVQQRLIDTQRALDQEYGSLRQAQARMRALFASAPEPVMIVELPALRIAEANGAAQALGGDGRRAAGGTLTDLFDRTDRAALTRLLATRGGGRERMRLRAGGAVTLHADTLVEDGRTLAIVRLLDLPPGLPADEIRLRDALRMAPDGVVTTGENGDVLWANEAFAAMAEVAEGDATGRALRDWVGRTGVDVDVLTGALRQHGTVRLFATVIRGDGGSSIDVEISAVRVEHAGTGTGATSTFIVRNVARRVESEPTPAERAMPRSLEQLTELIGRVSLKDLVRDATDVIERLCIEAALELTGNNRAAAAEMLGVSRQSLYVKLRRFGLVDAEDGEASATGSDAP